VHHWFHCLSVLLLSFVQLLFVLALFVYGYNYVSMLLIFASLIFACGSLLWILMVMSVCLSVLFIVVHCLFIGL
jgi:hypothetical protein